MLRSTCAGVIAALITIAGISASAQTQTPNPTITAPTPTVRPTGPGRLTARAADLIPIPSRIEHGVVSVRNAGSVASAPSVVTVNCHLPGEEGGCVDVPAALIAAYENPAYPNRLVVNVPAIQPGHVYNHTLTFWDDISWPTGAYQFDYVADAGSAVAETNEGNNTASHTWNVP